jgi:hypothetical protein
VPGIERAVLDAVIECEAHQVDFLDPSLFQVMSESGVALVGVVEKRAVAINVSLSAFVKNMSDSTGVE